MYDVKEYYFSGESRTERDVISDWLQSILKSIEKTNDLEVRSKLI